MKHLSQIIKLDIKAAIKAFEADDFDHMNIFANRAMANAIMGKKKELILPGFFMKDLALSYGIIQARRGTALQTAKVVGNRYLKSLEKMVDKGELNDKELWEIFYKLSLDLRVFLRSDFEKEAYTSDDPEFAHSAFIWLLKYLKQRKDVLLNPRNLLFKGIINEMDRIFKVHGGFKSEIYAISMLKALDRYYDYFRSAYRTNGTIDEEKVKSLIFPYVDEITSIVSSQRVNMSKMMRVLWELVSKWRKFFIEYMELRRPGIAIEKAIELPEEAKRKLTESVTKALEREVKAK
jgi:hypothetical protein